MAVGRPDADAVARRDPGGEEGAGGLRDGVPELAVGGAVVLAAEDEGVAVAVAADGGAEVVADGPAEERRAAGAVGIRKGGRGVGVHDMAQDRKSTNAPQADPAGLPCGPLLMRTNPRPKIVSDRGGLAA